MVSILMAVYQGEDSLPETLRSIERQTYREWELIAVNDGSIDATDSVLIAFKQKHSDRVTILRNPENIGLTKSLILAVQRSTGAYLARIDASDGFTPDKLEKQVAFLQQNPNYGIVGCNYVNVYLPSRVTNSSNAPLTDVEIRRAILRKNPFAHSCVLMRKDIYQKSGGYDPAVRYGQDYDLWFRLLKLTKAANLPDYLCTRFMDEGSISFQKQRSQMWQTLKTQWRYIKKSNPKHYLYLLEPLVVMVTPLVIRRWKRRR